MEVICEDKKQQVHPEDDVGKRIMDLLVSLYEDQTGEKYEYELISTGEETA